MTESAKYFDMDDLPRLPPAEPAGPPMYCLHWGDVPPWMERYGTVLKPEAYPHPYDHWTATVGGLDVETDSTVPVFRIVGRQ